MGDDKRQLRSDSIKFNDNGAVISFNYSFKVSGDYPVRIIADDKELMQYFVEVED